MKIVCYAFKNQDNELEAPFLEYLKKYTVCKHDPAKMISRKIKQAVNIEKYLKYLIDNDGKYNIPPIVQKYKNYDLGILKIKESKKLVRIAFFTAICNKIILIDAFDKPKLYEKSKKKEIDKMIKKFLIKAEKYKNDYISLNLSLPLTSIKL